MIWTAQHEEILLREILTYEPFNHKSGTIQRGESWKLIAESLNSLDEPKYTVTHRSVREKYTVMEKNYKKRTSSEEKSSGIAPDELSDYEKALEEIIAKFVDIELCVAKERENSAKAIEKERETAADMRQQCMETFSETNKRKDNAAGEQTTTKRRKSGDDSIAYLREK